jgi:hypothetical protein
MQTLDVTEYEVVPPRLGEIETLADAEQEPLNVAAALQYRNVICGDDLIVGLVSSRNSVAFIAAFLLDCVFN